MGFIYASLMALLLQKVVLPLLPEMHAGHGLLINDAILFHNIAAEMADRIHTYGWSEWRLFPPRASGNVGLLSAIYALLGKDPAWFIPVNAAAHAAGAVLIYKLGGRLSPGKVGLLGGLMAGNARAKAGVDSALFDLAGRILGVPAVALLGGPVCTEIPVIRIVAIADIDTRALTRKLRSGGVLRGVVATGSQHDERALVARAQGIPSMEGLDLVKDVTTATAFDWTSGAADGYDIPAGRQASRRLKIAAYDFGMKWNILRCLTQVGCDVTVVPGTATAEEVLSHDPDGIFLSNGPGDPEPCDYAIAAAKELIETGIPTFGICLGHQIVGRAAGADTRRLRFGHHGANHPVKDMTTGKVEITSMNHGFAVDKDSLPKSVEQTHVSLFDGSNCGIAMKDLPVFSVQYHPEASPGPRDSHYLFTRFVDLMRARKSSATSRRQAG